MIRRKARGQGLVEYALIIVLVALVVVIAASVLGVGLQRVYGIAVAGLGTKKDHEGSTYIRIERSECWGQIIEVREAGSGTLLNTYYLTGLFVSGTTNVPLSELDGSTDRFMDTPVDGTKFVFTPNADESGVEIPGSFVFNPLISGTVSDATMCPRAVVIQRRDGSAIAVAPVKVNSGTKIVYD